MAAGVGMEEYKPCAAMVVAQCIYAAMALWAKAVFTRGMSPMVFVVYRQAIATVVLVPITIVANRYLPCMYIFFISTIFWSCENFGSYVYVPINCVYSGCDDLQKEDEGVESWNDRLLVGLRGFSRWVGGTRLRVS